MAVRVSWKRFNEIGTKNSWTPIYRCHEALIAAKGGYCKQIWTFKEEPRIETIKPKAA